MKLDIDYTDLTTIIIELESRADYYTQEADDIRRALNLEGFAEFAGQDSAQSYKETAEWFTDRAASIRRIVKELKKEL